MGVLWGMLFVAGTAAASELVPLPPQNAVYESPATASRRGGAPHELTELLEMKSSFGSNDTAVRQMRPTALREAAQLVTLQTAMSWRYAQLMTATERYAAILDTAFDFGPLLMTQGEALIMPPVLTRAGASMRIENPDTATASSASYELLEPAHYVSAVPNWRWYLMADAFPKPEKPNPAVMPKNREERLIWQEAVREAWALGMEEADRLYQDNVSRMVRDYRGIMLYHLLTAQHLLSQVRTSSANLGIKSKDNKLHVDQRMYRITSPALFTPSKAVSGVRKERMVVAGNAVSKEIAVPPSTRETTPQMTDAPPVAAPERADMPPATRNGGYQIEGAASWKPLQVYDDGKQTYVRMPKTLAAKSDMPVLLVRRTGGDVLAGYAVNGDTLVVDGTFQEAVLLRGLGSNQQRVTLRQQK